MNSAIVAVVLPANEHVLEHYVRSHVSTILTLRESHPESKDGLRERLERLGGDVEFLESFIDEETDTRLRAEASRRAQQTAADFSFHAAANEFNAYGFSSIDTAHVFGATIEVEFFRSMRIVEALTIASSRFAIELVVLNEDVCLASKTIALWAKTMHVPTLHISHSAIMGTLIPVHQERNTDEIVLFGEKASEAYAAAGIDIGATRYIGNPAWDRYSSLLHDRVGTRRKIEELYAISHDAKIILFTPTWAGNFTALADRTIYMDSMRAVLRAYAEVRQRSHTHLIVKDRSPNEVHATLVRELAAQVGLPSDSFTVTLADLPSLLVCAWVAVVVNSNVAIEAAICGVPAINIWSPLSWLTGPYFGASQEVIEAMPSELPDTLHRILECDLDRVEVQRMATVALARIHPVNDGSCGMRVANVMLELREKFITADAFGNVAMSAIENV